MKFFFFLFIAAIVFNSLGAAKKAAKSGAKRTKSNSGTDWEDYSPEDHTSGNSSSKIETLYKARDKSQALNTVEARAAAKKLLYSGLPRVKAKAKTKAKKARPIKKGRSFAVTNRQANERGPLVRDMNRQRIRGLSSARKTSGISATSVIGAVAVALIGIYMARTFG